MRLLEKVAGLDRVVPHHAEQGRAVATPVVLAQRGRGVLVEADVLDDVAGHRRADRRERGMARVVQRVVEVEQPDAPGASGRRALQCERIIVP